MHILHNNRLNIHDLPNEILFIIAKELNIVDLYSLIDIDERFAQIVLDPLYIHNLDMTNKTMKSYFNYTFSIDDRILSGICEKILPQIHGYVKKLTIEQNSIVRILTVNYPQLYSLSLINFEEKVLFQYLTDHSILRNLVTHQITHLNIDIQDETTSQVSDIRSNILALILSLTKRLAHLNFCEVFSHRKSSICMYNLRETSCMSSNLTQLKISVENFWDCLYLVDGRLSSLSKLIVSVNTFSQKSTPFFIDRTKEIPQLKCFSLTLNNYQEEYDPQIVLLLQRMINLEELTLFLLVFSVDGIYIDGIQLHDDILVYMPQLTTFTFSINTGVKQRNANRLPSNEDVQNSFHGRRYGEVGSYVIYHPNTNVGQCHVYSLPFQFEHFFNLNNSFHFQHGIFDKVRRLTMNDSHPFEHDFFKLTSYYFPLVEVLTIYNGHPQQHKKNSSTSILFPRLILLNLINTHYDYVKQFLLAKNTRLPSLLDLCITYQSLTMLTKNFSNDPTHFNLTQVKKLDMEDMPFVRPKAFQKFFPLL